MSKRSLLLLNSILSIVFGGASLYFFSLKPALAIVLHILAVIFALFGFLYLAQKVSGKAWLPALCFVLGFAAMVPFLGVLFVCGFALMQAFIPPPAPGEKWHIGESEYLTAVPDYAPPSASPQSVMEVLAGTDSAARRKAILRLRFVEARRAIPILQRAVQDSDEQVRILAQSQLSKMIGRLEVDIKFLEAQLQSRPAFSTRLELAERYHELVFLGISSQETAVIYLERCLTLIEAALQSRPDDPNALFLQLKCQVRLKNMTAAEAVITRLEALNYEPAVLLPWKVEVAYLRRDWPGVRELMKQTKDTSDRLVSVSSFWLTPQLT